MKYEQPVWNGREQALADLDSSDRAARAVIALALNEDDSAFAERQFISLLKDGSRAPIHQAAAVGLGHLARRFGKVSSPETLPLLRKLGEGNDHVASAARNSIDDIEHFCR